MARLTDIRIDEQLWQSASPARRQEWRVAVEEVVQSHRFQLAGLDAADPFAISLSQVDNFVKLDLRSDGKPLPLEQLMLSTGELARHFGEYLDICRQMGKAQAQQESRLEALDIAKRISHDEAAEKVAELCRPLGPDHATARRLFTLLLALHFDTTRLVLPHHRC